MPHAPGKAGCTSGFARRPLRAAARFPGVGIMDIVQDSRLKGDAAILESEMGVVEASVELQLQALEQGFAKLLGSRV